MSEKLCFEVILRPSHLDGILVETRIRLFDWNSCKGLHYLLEKKMLGLVSRPNILARVVNSGDTSLRVGSVISLSDACCFLEYLPLVRRGLREDTLEGMEKRRRLIEQEADTPNLLKPYIL